MTNKAHIVDDCGVKQWFHFKHSIAAKIFIYVYLFTDLGFFKLVKFRLFTSVKHRRRLVTKKNKAPECEWGGLVVDGDDNDEISPLVPRRRGAAVARDIRLGGGGDNDYYARCARG